MLARRREQENLVNELQTAAASKPLNQEVRGLAPKTPGDNKHQQSKVPLKHTGRGDENVNTIAKQKENKFVTPVAPRERVPLGAKTTNAKSKAFQTPAPLTAGPGGGQRTQRRSASGRKAKLKVHQPESLEADPISLEDEDDEDVPEVEYCPPKITELPDIPDLPYPFAPDETFPQLQGDNFCRGGWTLYCNPIGDDGLSLSDRQNKKRREELDLWVEQDLQKAMEEYRADFDMPCPQDIQSGNRRAGPSTVKSKEAVAALSAKPQPHYAAPTAAAKARGNAPKPLPKQNKNASLASRSTIGYAKGRKVSAERKAAASTEADENTKPKKFWERFQEGVQREEELMDQLRSRYQIESDDEIGGKVIPWAKDPEELVLDDDEPFVFRFQRGDD